MSSNDLEQLRNLFLSYCVHERVYINTFYMCVSLSSKKDML